MRMIKKWKTLPEDLSYIIMDYLFHDATFCPICKKIEEDKNHVCYYVINGIRIYPKIIAIKTCNVFDIVFSFVLLISFILLIFYIILVGIRW
jgi:hypothetical protein